MVASGYEVKKGASMVFDFWKKKTEINTTQIVDEIEAAVYERVKPYGFKKHGRTLHRFVSEDISQVIHFQSGMPTHGMSGLLCVNLGKSAFTSAVRVARSSLRRLISIGTCSRSSSRPEV